MIRDKNTQIVDITHCPLFCDILSHAKTRDEREEIYENNYYNLQLVSYELEKYRKLEEEYGCTLKVVTQALKKSNFEGLFVDTTDNDGFEWKGFEKCNLMYDAFNNRFYWCNGSFCIPLSDYKKRWWLKKDKSE